MSGDVAVRLATPADLPALPGIERAAAELFAGTAHHAAVVGDATSLEQFAGAQRAGHLWVATAGDAPVGFAFMEIVGDAAHLDELDVHPDHGGRGIGTALVRAVCEWAARSDYAGVTLTTYRDVPWNAPFYQKLGFRVLPPAEYSDALRALVGHEAAMGLRPEDRYVMRWDAPPTR